MSKNNSGTSSAAVQANGSPTLSPLDTVLATIDSLETLRARLFSNLSNPEGSGGPKYQRLSEVLIEAIRQGIWKPGDRLPTEEVLTEMTPFSLGTVQRALHELAEQGFIVRQHGLGNFITDQQRRLQDPWHCQFLADDGTTVLPVYSKAVNRAIVRGPGPWTMHLDAADTDIMRLNRIINVNDEFSIFSRFYADRHLLKRLWQAPLEELDGANFKQIIAHHAGLSIMRVSHHVRLERINAEVAGATQLPIDTTVLFMTAIAYARWDACVYYQEFYIPQNRYALRFPEYPPKPQHYLKSTGSSE